MNLDYYGSRARPRDLVPGDPAAVDADAERLRALASSLDDVATRVTKVDAGEWTGAAADAFADYRTERRDELHRLADIADGSAHVLTDHASALRAAQERAASAISKWRAAERLSAQDPTNLAVWAMQDEARVIAHEARKDAAAAEGDAASKLRAMVEDLPYRPSFWNHVDHHASELVAGAGAAFRSLADLARAAVLPHERVAFQQASADALAAGARDPIGFRNALIDAETLVDSPARWVGGFAPDLLGAAVTGGGAAAASRGVRAADNLAATGSAARAADRVRTRPAPAGAPKPLEMGEWKPVTESMSDRAAAYQDQITGAPGHAYVVNGVKFDGVTDDFLVDAKGPGFAHWIREGEFPEYYRGGRQAFEQARRQLDAADGAPITWFVAEREFADYLTDAFEDRGWDIQVLHVPPVS